MQRLPCQEYLTTALSLADTGVTDDHNIVVKSFDDYFVNYASGNLHLKEGCEAVDGGSADYAPAIDREGTPRPVGKGVDIGAYEFSNAHAVLPGNRGFPAGGVSYLVLPGRFVVSFPEPYSGEIRLFDCRGRCAETVRCVRRQSIP